MENIKEEQNLSIEESLDKIEDIIRSLEDPDVPLKESLQLYTEGALLVASCKEAIGGIEKEIQILEEQGDA